MAASDIFRLAGFLFVFALMLVFGLHILREFNSNVDFTSTEAQEIVDNTSDAYTAADYSVWNAAASPQACTAVALYRIGEIEASMKWDVASGLVAGNAGRCIFSTANKYLGFSAEL